MDAVSINLCSFTCLLHLFVYFFFFNDTATTEIYTLSLHDALPICTGFASYLQSLLPLGAAFRVASQTVPDRRRSRARSEEHTSELQSPCNLVCRLLLEKKKNNYHSNHRSKNRIHILVKLSVQLHIS